MANIKISETNPFEETVFLIRVAVNEKAPAHMKVRNVEIILEEFHAVMKKIQEKGIIPLQNWPTGNEE